MVDVGALLPIDLDVHEELVHDGGRCRILEALMRHHMAPMAGGIADREQNGAVAAFRLGEGLRTPFPPVDGVVAMLEQIGAGGSGEAVHRTLLPGAGVAP